MGRKKKTYPDAVDFQILGYLHGNGAATSTSLKQLVGVHENMTRFNSSHRHFLDNHWIKKYTIVPRWERYGYDVIMMFHLKVDLVKNVQRVSSYILGKLERVLHAYETDGEFQITFSVVARDMEEVYDYFTPVVEEAPHVIDYRRSLVRKVTEEFGFIPPRREYMYDYRKAKPNDPKFAVIDKQLREEMYNKKPERG